MVVDYEAAMEGLYYIDGVVASAFFFFVCMCRHHSRRSGYVTMHIFCCVVRVMSVVCFHRRGRFSGPPPLTRWSDLVQQYSKMHHLTKTCFLFVLCSGVIGV